MSVRQRSGWNWAWVAVACLLLGACASPRRTPAPVEDRTGARPAIAAPSPTVAGATTSEPARLPAGAENAGKAGYYTVKPGDTLIRIGLESGQNWRDVARWNSLDNPNLIETGQVLRVVPPGAAVASAPSNTDVVTRPVAAASAAPAPLPPASATPSTPPRATPTVAPAAPVASTPAASAEDEVAWSWPTSAGTVLAGFDEQKNKGLDISGRAGDAVLASADGRVVYAGAGLRGYGNLIILKHNNTYLTAYAHNQALLVKEDQSVRKGQKIAEMGSTDTDRVKLHFEIRRQGKPVDPAKYLPPR